MESLLLDLRHAARALRKHPAFAAVAVLALTLGIGANTAIFSIVRGVLLRPLPYPEPARLMIVDETSSPGSGDTYNVSYPNFLEWRRRARSFDSLAALRADRVALTGSEEPARVLASWVSPELFPMLGVTPVAGRLFLPSENEPGGDPVLLLSHGCWQRRYGGREDVVGQAVTVDGDPYTIIGVLPDGFEFPSPSVEVYGALGRLANYRSMQNRKVHVLRVVGRLAPGATRETAATEMEALAAQIRDDFPGEDDRHGASVMSLHDRIVGDVRPALVVLLGAVGFVLLIACANVANLLLARSATRAREMAVRAVLGASRGRVVRQLLTESVLLGLAGGLCSLLLASWSLDLLAARLAETLPRAANIRLDASVLGFTLAISVATGLLFGLLPAWQASRPDLADALRERTGAGGNGAGARRTRQVLMVAEVALSLLLLVGAALMLKSFWRLTQQSPGFRAERLLMASVYLPEAGYPEIEPVQRLLQAIPDELGALPGVEAVGAVNNPPISGGDSQGQLTIEGQPLPPDKVPAASYRRVLPGYFQAMGVPLLQGRSFDAADDGRDPVVIVSETLARRFFPDGDPLGARIKVGPPENEPWLRIIGVVGDVHNVGIDQTPLLATYEPAAQRPWRAMTFLVRTAGDPDLLVAPVQARLRAAAPGILIDDVGTMERRIAASLAPRRLNLSLMGLFAGLALALAAIGLYGVMAYLVTRRTREIGVRVALGAGRRDILELVVGQGLRLSLAGIVVGALAGLALSRLLAGLLYDVSPTDPAAFFAVAVLLLFVSLAACYLPARRAARVDPAIALRDE